MDRPIFKRYLPHIVALVAISALAVVSGLLWMERRNRFPVLEPGAYVGRLIGAFNAEGNSTVPFYAERRAGEHSLLLSVVRDQWVPKIIMGQVTEGDSGSVLPIALEGPDATLRFIGGHVEGGRYAGEVQNLEGNISGRWELEMLTSGPEKLPPAQLEQLRLWLKLKEEISNTLQQIDEIQFRIPQEKSEVEKLASFMGEGERLKESANEKYAIVQRELEKVQADLKVKQARAKTLEERLDLSQKVTGMGRLVLLARQSLDRDGRWVESMLKVGGDPVSPEMRNSLVTGDRVLGLREAIAHERQLIDQLSGDAVR